MYHIFSNFVIFKCPIRTWPMVVLEESHYDSSKLSSLFWLGFYQNLGAHTYPLGHSYLIFLWEAPQVFYKSLARQLLCIPSERLKTVQIRNEHHKILLLHLPSSVHSTHKGMLGVPSSGLDSPLVTLWPVLVDGDLETQTTDTRVQITLFLSTGL